MWITSLAYSNIQQCWLYAQKSIIPTFSSLIVFLLHSQLKHLFFECLLEIICFFSIVWLCLLFTFHFNVTLRSPEAANMPLFCYWISPGQWCAVFQRKQLKSMAQSYPCALYCTQISKTKVSWRGNQCSIWIMLFGLASWVLDEGDGRNSLGWPLERFWWYCD